MKPMSAYSQAQKDSYNSYQPTVFRGYFKDTPPECHTYLSGIPVPQCVSVYPPPQ